MKPEPLVRGEQLRHLDELVVALLRHIIIVTVRNKAEIDRFLVSSIALLVAAEIEVDAGFEDAAIDQFDLVWGAANLLE